MMSTFHGEIKEIPGISVDNFEKLESRAYFLSHCHFDHTYGLYEKDFLSYLIRKRYYVYTSIHTARIIAHRKPALKNYLKPLKLGLEIIRIPGDEDKSIDEKYVTVTLIPAGHCFGSVMFLFETLDKTVLFTGDFRISEDDVHKYKDLHFQDNVKTIDTLYVDTEFQSTEYADFPKRSECVAYAIIEIRKWLRKSERRRVALHVSAEFGYEYIFNVIFKELGLKVYVSDNSWEFYSQVQDLVPGVTNDPNSRIHLCSNKHECDSHEKCMKTDQDDSDNTKDLNKNDSVNENCSKNLSTADNSNKNLDIRESINNNDITMANCSNYHSGSDNKNSSLTENSSKNQSITDNSSKNQSITDNSSKNQSITENSSKNQYITENSSKNQSTTENCSKNSSTTEKSNTNAKILNEIKKGYLYMHFSARKWKNYIEGDKLFYTDYKANRTDVCFATHCSRNELIYFVNYLMPKNIVGFRDPYLGPVNCKISY